MKLKNPSGFLRDFGTYCYLDPGKDAATSERARLSNKFAWYETHFANMVVDFVESGAGAGVGLEGYVCLREERGVDVALVPPQLQREVRYDDDWHSPLWHKPELFSECVCIETKVVREGRWVDDWVSAFRDLHRKDGKPQCDYLLACIYGYLCERKRLRKSQNKPSYEKFLRERPSDELQLDCGKRIAEAQKKKRVEYVARWPSLREEDDGTRLEDGMVKLRPLRWNQDALCWSDKTYVFLVLLAPAAT